jgi:hypothetical protein
MDVSYTRVSENSFLGEEIAIASHRVSGRNECRRNIAPYRRR